MPARTPHTTSSQSTPTLVTSSAPAATQTKRGVAHTVRKTIFWLHLVCGVIVGIVIAIMCFTGAALAFQNELIAWAERDQRHAPATTPAQPLPISELLARAREAALEFQPATLTLTNDPQTAYTLSTGGRGQNAATYYQNQYTGELREQSAPKLRAFMNTMLMLHRWLALEGDNRPIGKAISGACNIAFTFLALSGIYIWCPRRWTWRALRPSLIVSTQLRGKARDWNWHNALGFWFSPILIVLTLTALPISYRWAGNLIYTAYGETPPASPQQGQGNSRGERQDRPRNGERNRDNAEAKSAAPALTANQLITRVQTAYPAWDRISLRLALSESTAPITITLRETIRWPRTATTQLTLSPETGEILKRETFADSTPARRLRTWTRYLHTGEALGWPGQLAAGLACLIGLVLCYTGFALSFRRLLKRRNA